MKFILQSKTDKKEFQVDQKVVDASSLLKNICELTQITEPIIVNCKSHSLNVFIQLINHYEVIDMDYHDTVFEQQFYRKNFKTDHQLIQCIQDLCILDSDFFIDSIADYILEKMKGMSRKEIQKYLGVEDDYTVAERKEIDENLMEYFLSINFGRFKFPFENMNLYSLKTKFSTPMNVLLARIIQRSNEEIASSLSLINKTMKNECDRNPLKLLKFSSGQNGWVLSAAFDNMMPHLFLDMQKNDKATFDYIKNRKVIGKEFSIFSDSIAQSDETLIRCSSLDFVIPNKCAKAVITIYKDTNLIYHFDVAKCPLNTIKFDLRNFYDAGKEFEEVYDHLIAKDLSKEIELLVSNMFNFVEGTADLRFYKKPFASQFFKLHIFGIVSKKIKFLPSFKKFVLNYMEDDGIIICAKQIIGCPKKPSSGNHYPISFIKEHLESITSL